MLAVPSSKANSWPPSLLETTDGEGSMFKYKENDFTFHT